MKVADGDRKVIRQGELINSTRPQAPDRQCETENGYEGDHWSMAALLCCHSRCRYSGNGSEKLWVVDDSIHFTAVPMHDDKPRAGGPRRDFCLFKVRSAVSAENLIFRQLRWRRRRLVRRVTD